MTEGRRFHNAGTARRYIRSMGFSLPRNGNTGRTARWIAVLDYIGGSRPWRVEFLKA